MNRLYPCAALACAVALLAAALMPTRSFAANYSESVDGELPSANPLTLITFDPGLNTVSGTFGNIGFPTDYDSFAFTIPGGLSLAGGGALIEEVFSLSPGAGAIGGLPAGTYHMGADFFNVFGQSTADYTFSFGVVPVPEPATLVLLALAAPALIRTRKTPISKYKNQFQI